MVARSEEKVLAKVIELIRQMLYLPSAEITGQTNLKQDFGLDSLDIAQAFLDLEVEFGFEFSYQTVWECENLGQVARYIAGRAFGRATTAEIVTLAA
jgi:acyl carrier protein